MYGRAVVAVCGIALGYTIIWDNYLVYSQVWWYPDDRVLTKIGYVPLEEYLFFLLQPLLAGWALSLKPAPSKPTAVPPSTLGFRALGAGVLISIAITGVPMLAGGGRWTYLGLILVWAVPPLAGMWWLGAEWVRARAAAIAVTTAAVTLPLWVADRYAIASGIWTIAAETSLPFVPFGLPVEEATFFLLTTVLSTWGTTLLVARYAPSSTTRDART